MLLPFGSLVILCERWGAGSDRMGAEWDRRFWELLGGFVVFFFAFLTIIAILDKWTLSALGDRPVAVVATLKDNNTLNMKKLLLLMVCLGCLLVSCERELNVTEPITADPTRALFDFGDCDGGGPILLITDCGYHDPKNDPSNKMQNPGAHLPPMESPILNQRQFPKVRLSSSAPLRQVNFSICLGDEPPVFLSVVNMKGETVAELESKKVAAFELLLLPGSYQLILTYTEPKTTILPFEVH